MFDFAAHPLGLNIAIFAAATVVIGVAGVAMVRTADELADRTGMGEAVMGALLLGGSTSLAGSVASVSAAAQGLPDIAISNAVGGIAAQTAFLGIADIAYRRANLEHAAASSSTLTQAALLVAMLAIPLVAMSAPEFTVFAIHPVSLALPVAYALGLRLISQAHLTPMWRPLRTAETRTDVPATYSGERPGMLTLWLRFAVLAGTVALAGYGVAQTGQAISAQTGLTQTLVGALLIAVSTSIPELVTTVAAVRQGALTLAVGDIIGGNSFDVLFLAFSDVGFRDGSIYHAFTQQHLFIVSVSMLMTGVLLLGLLRRQRHGFGNIGFESLLILALYGVALLVIGAGG